MCLRFCIWLALLGPLAYAEKAPPWIDTDAPKPEVNTDEPPDAAGPQYLDVDPSETLDEAPRDKIPDIQTRKYKKKRKSRRRRSRSKGRRFVSNTELSLMMQTPLIEENFYDARFKSYGLLFLNSIPGFVFKRRIHVHVEFGLGTMFSRLALTQPATTITHIHFALPLRLRALYALKNKRLVAEGFVGIYWNLFEYDSRDTTDGGFHMVDSLTANLEPDFGVGINYLFDGWSMRLTAGFISVALGMAISL